MLCQQGWVWNFRLGDGRVVRVVLSLMPSSTVNVQENFEWSVIEVRFTWHVNCSKNFTGDGPWNSAVLSLNKALLTSLSLASMSRRQMYVPSVFTLISPSTAISWRSFGKSYTVLGFIRKVLYIAKYIGEGLWDSEIFTWCFKCSYLSGIMHIISLTVNKAFAFSEWRISVDASCTCYSLFFWFSDLTGFPGIIANQLIRLPILKRVRSKDFVRWDYVASWASHARNSCLWNFYPKFLGYDRAVMESIRFVTI